MAKDESLITGKWLALPLEMLVTPQSTAVGYVVLFGNRAAPMASRVFSSVEIAREWANGCGLDWYAVAPVIWNPGEEV